MIKTRDGRFIDKRVLIDKKLLKTLILGIKSEKKLSWKKFANILGISEQTLRIDWMNNKSTIPYSVLKKILLLNKNSIKFKDIKDIKILEPFWGQKISNGKDKTKKISIPNKHSESFAEFYGILLGDGCLFSDLKGLSITSDKLLDYDYSTIYLKTLIYNLFNLYPKYYFSKNVRKVRCVLYSKNVVNYLSSLGFPIGIKNNLIIPSFIYDNKKTLIKCLRGIMDTDGCLAGHPHSRIMIHLSITSKNLREQVHKALINLKIKPCLFNKGIMIYGVNAIKFCDIVGFSNLKNNIKYKFFLKQGRVPRSNEVESFIRAGKSDYLTGPIG